MSNILKANLISTVSIFVFFFSLNKLNITENVFPHAYKMITLHCLPNLTFIKKEDPNIL